jgi:hypothetical protein
MLGYYAYMELAIYVIPDHLMCHLLCCSVVTVPISIPFLTVAYPGILFERGGGSTSSVEDGRQKERGSGGGSPIVRGSGGSCNLVQEISFHIVRFS